LYVLGGNSDNQRSDDIYRAPIGALGVLGTWEQVGQTPEPITGMGVALFGNKVFVYGGSIDSGATDHVWRGEVDGNGQVGNWQAQLPLPAPVDRGGFASTDNLLLVAGGIFTANTYYAEVDDQGTMGPWTTGAALPHIVCCGSLTVGTNGYAYLTGGFDGARYVDTVYASKVAEPLGPTPSPTTAATPTNTPTPTIPQPTPTPTAAVANTVVVVPGMGASWNTDALLNCKDSGYSGGWGMASYADKVYRPLIQSLGQSGFKVQEFYYDWRKDVRNNGLLLGDYLNVVLKNGDRVYMVGHSMGGLVGRAYLETTSQTLLSKMMTVGSPHQGTVLAYPAWSAGEIWEGDLLTNIGAAVALRRCGIGRSDRAIINRHFPSFQNLLPTFDYLRTKKPSGLKPVNTMNAKNNWLPTGFEAGQTNTQLFTLGGIGRKTLKELAVREPNKSEIKSGDWKDGYPIDRVYVPDGDGTVLLSSSQIKGADNRIIARSHSGLVTSAESIEVIKNTLEIGAARLMDTKPHEEQAELVGALVVIGEAKFEINGKLTEDIAVVFNPTPGVHQYKINPKRATTRVDVGQFMPDGQVKWTQTKLQGLGERKRSVVYGF